ncbi:hypothetical protein V2K77_06865 [Pseudomonas alliivorans]|nr:hypothetical protein [Pseudomonas alliivorans]MEE4709554.1 hypothetical protein [Pseudomonas alliivorans]MEE4726188.1 hypothetical protein [Pseudomonas alliivorans]MEE4767262.1 hypothetical protein [Pseudomonas alliivorans]
MKSAEQTVHLLNLETLTNDQYQTVISNCAIERLVIRCTSDRKISIGSLCYGARDADSRKIPKPVDESSLCPARARAIRAWCAETGNRHIGSGYTFYTNATEFVSFSDWCDGNQHCGFLANAEAYKTALDEFSIHLQWQVQSAEGIGTFTANRLQSQAIKSAYIIFPGSPLNFLTDLPIISHSSLNKETTETPSMEEMTAHLTRYRYLFDGLTDFVLKGLAFPCRIPYMDTEATLLPAEYAITTPAVHQTAKVGNHNFWNYRDGKVNSLEECKARSSQTERHLIRQRHEALRELNDANFNLRHRKRIWLAALAQDAFISHFVANTGMNEAPMRKLVWSNDYTVENSENAGFVVIKQRAGGMEQYFEIQKPFLKDFKKFLKLREYLTNGLPHPYLFINITLDVAKPIPIKSSCIHFANGKIRSFLEPKFSGLGYQKLRKYKSVYLLSTGHPVEVVSALMQTSGKTVLKHYASAEEKNAIDEITEVMTLARTIFESHYILPTPASGCGGGEPEETVEPPEAYQPNCRNFVGCIFCSKFRMHADENSIRKVLSMRWVTSEFLNACTDAQQFHTVHGNAILRIDALMAELIQFRPEARTLVERITLETTEHFHLTDYWERLYSRLIRTKVIQ